MPYLLSLFISILLSIPCFAVENNTAAERQQSIDRALAWLRSQQKDNGSIQEGDYSSTMTALAINAHLASGITYHHPQHGAWLHKSLLYVLKQQDSKGYFGSRDKGRMYGHGICTLMLAESIGMSGNPATEPRIRSALESALQVTIAAAQVKKEDRFRGGWHYEPNGDHSDMSLSGWQLLSLHAAAQAGFTVPDEIINGGITYTRQLCDPKKGTVAYDNVSSPRISLRGVGLLCLTIRKNDADAELSEAIATAIRNDPIEWKGPWFFYRAYYDVAGLGRAYPQHLKTYQAHVNNALINNQDKEGWWHTPPGDNEGRYGKVYLTALAVLALSIERQLLPAYQP